MRHIESLLAFAHSTRLRCALQYRMSVGTAPVQARTVKLPTTQEQWMSIVEAAYTEHSDSQWRESEELLNMFPSEDCVCPLHCEGQLIQYLTTKRNDGWDNIAPFSYLGVSKLSCNACANWIEVFNKQGGRQFYIGGMEGKWRWPWGMPMVEGAVVKDMACKFAGEYRGYRRRKFWKELNDPCSSRWGFFHPTTDQRALSSAMIDEGQPEYHGNRLEYAEAVIKFAEAVLSASKKSEMLSEEERPNWIMRQSEGSQIAE